MFILFSDEPTESNFEALDTAIAASEEEAKEMQVNTGYSVYKLVPVE